MNTFLRLTVKHALVEMLLNPFWIRFFEFESLDFAEYVIGVSMLFQAKKNY